MEFVHEFNNNSKERTITRILTVDSKFRDDHSDTQTSRFQSTLVDRITNVQKMELIEYSGPSNIRLISNEQKNNYLFITISYTDNTYTTKYVSVPDVYHIERNNTTSDVIVKFITTLNNQISKLSGDYANIQFKFNYNIDTTNVLSLATMDRGVTVSHDNLGNSKPIDNISLDFVSSPTGNGIPIQMEQSLGYMLGFRTPHIIIYPDANTNKFTRRCDAIVDINNLKYAYLIVDDYNSNSESNIIAGQMTSTIDCKGKSLCHGGNILGKIIYRNELNYNFFNRVISTPRDYYGKINLQRLKVSLVNEYGEYLDTKNLDWSFTLRLTTGV